MKLKRDLSSSELVKLAAEVRKDLHLDAILGDLGQVHLVGSAALDLMVWPDLDLTIVVEKLDIEKLYAAGAKLAKHTNVRQFNFRDDTGKWNTEPEKYPDGVYWGVDYRNELDTWKIDIWFVSDASKQPDLQHLKEMAPRLTQGTRESILAIKKAWVNRPEYGSKVTSYLIYTAVLDNGVRSVEEFETFLGLN